ncbi:MerR family transcriptional regulator [Vibrio fluvialis]|uniref:MerR family transcriptional regulator n=1 Tax=Vibrio fluvialis TaxID=676 RepID=UPI0013024C22|nr:MerR family DNA-binding transcriptional regulator [Vibrio fluvialis]EKO3451163.1 MerR family DNA-binding transcriptional regulator [Vibrio fluvialis]EKO3460200.1 MerR family DNA-binding transcriptional regulator [Vibrio fluvialis]EKO5123410.1 MerR family DNA-binding transcriptional regulator [Vibrio fluvialis]ELO1779428.1 MerR family DNA-binding transcriptional regulator [Vibrio fluvialis]EMA2480611.1 MerR family DNA-binding transcriptional regulator [Vibrio fluvialis]
METFKISELAKEFDITTRSIRFYEDMGLIEPERKGTVRIYHRRDKIRLKLIMRGKRLGFSLAEIRELFELYDTHQGETQLVKMLNIIDEKKAVLQRQLDDIGVVMGELEAARQRCELALKAQ